ncbi:ATP-dependent nuclease [Hydrogenophaga sp. ZJX-1]|uniref:ATP-dependent nuclease n=1 Tax=Hydrogenophaga sp. ZJX-1 TaxID=3404778 RepID=UPI003B27BECE
MSKIKAFRIKNFRSIVDTKWVQFSPDGITVLVGQNESGKTSILQALYSVLASASITDDDKRIGAPEPEVYLKTKILYSDIKDELSKYSFEETLVFEEYFKKVNGEFEIKFYWDKEKQKDGKLLLALHIDLIGIEDLLQDLASAKPSAEPPTTPKTAAITKIGEEEEEDEDAYSTLDGDKIVHIIYDVLPSCVLFNADSGLLPTSVDIDTKGNPTGPGFVAATNFLKIAEIDLPSLIRGDRRVRLNQLTRANERVTKDFTDFWSQVIGSNSKLSLKCEIANYDQSAGEKAGKEHLVFWVSDGNTQLYPKQRSLGVRWFVSFYLQLRATEKTKVRRIFLLDEPGANLHSKAQADVLKLINEIRTDVSIIYSTHSPDLIEYEKLFRVRAVQRNGEHEDSPTIVIDATHLGAASSDTLSPILSAMGSDMSNQSVIKKSRNVLLEEMSGYYYIKAFWKLTNTKEVAHFIAATGVNKLPILVNMFIGWGLDFIVAIDDDKQGREVYNQLKKEIFGDEDTLARKQLLKLPSCTSIEEIFSANDFKRYVLNNTDAAIGNTNSEYLKENQISKPVTAFQFFLNVNDNKIRIENFDAITTQKITTLVTSISDLVKNRATA